MMLYNLLLSLIQNSKNNIKNNNSYDNLLDAQYKKM